MSTAKQGGRASPSSALSFFRAWSHLAVAQTARGTVVPRFTRFRASEVWWLGPWAAFFNVVEAPKPTPSGRAEGQLPASTGLPAGPLGLLGLSEGLSYLVAPRPKTTQTESARSSPQNTERGIGPPCSHGCSRTTSRPGVAGRSASHPCRVNESDALIAGASCLCSEARPGFLELR